VHFVVGDGGFVMSSTELMVALDAVRRALKEAEEALEGQFAALRTAKAEPLMEETARCAEKLDAVSLSERIALETLSLLAGSPPRLDALPAELRPKVVTALTDLRARTEALSRKRQRNRRAAELLALTTQGLARSLGAEPDRRGFGIAARYGSSR
jgi:hypothetical protein